MCGGLPGSMLTNEPLPLRNNPELPFRQTDSDHCPFLIVKLGVAMAHSEKNLQLHPMSGAGALTNTLTNIRTSAGGYRAQ